MLCFEKKNIVNKFKRNNDKNSYNFSNKFLRSPKKKNPTFHKKEKPCLDAIADPNYFKIKLAVNLPYKNNHSNNTDLIKTP